MYGWLVSGRRVSGVAWARVSGVACASVASVWHTSVYASMCGWRLFRGETSGKPACGTDECDRVPAFSRS
jgi:hypothetical protein